MKNITVNMIRSWNPCYDPTRHLSEEWSGTAIDILNNEKIPFEDRLWVVLRTELVNEKVMRLFAVWSYRQTLSFIKNPDPRSIECANVSERFANGEATEDELSAAESAAWSAARSAAWSAAESAARSAAESAAWSAAESAARSAGSAAWSAAESAARSAGSAAWSAAESAGSAAWSAAESAGSAAWSAAESAGSAAWSAQKEKLIEMITMDNK